MNRFYGAGHDLERAVGTHLFGICPRADPGRRAADLRLRQKLPVKGAYDEMLTNMNERQLARLSGDEIAFNRVFRPHRDLLRPFGHDTVESRS